MSRKIDYIEAQYSKWIKEGRGSGEHQDYNPWLTVYDVLSDGCAHRVSGNCFLEIDYARRHSPRDAAS